MRIQPEFLFPAHLQVNRNVYFLRKHNDIYQIHPVRFWWSTSLLAIISGLCVLKLWKLFKNCSTSIASIARHFRSYEFWVFHKNAKMYRCIWLQLVEGLNAMFIQIRRLKVCHFSLSAMVVVMIGVEISPSPGSRHRCGKGWLKTWSCGPRYPSLNPDWNTMQIGYRNWRCLVRGLLST